MTIGGPARGLGVAGLLPAAIAALLIAVGQLQVGVALAVFYPLAILSFIGGSWWGFAMRREGDQPRLALIAITPVLVAMAQAAILFVTVQVGWVLVAIGSAVLLTLLVDQRLERRGVAPVGWLRLRVPLSVGLCALTILSGVLAGAPRLYV